MRLNYYKKFGNTANLKSRDFNMDPFIYSGSIAHKISPFEDAYIKLRQSENRLFTDEEVLQLPEVSPHHPHSKEWKIRKQSSRRLYKYLESFNKALQILEVGCGNGWLTALLSKIPNSTVTGIDVNQFELSQANKVFANIPNVKFITTSLEELLNEDNKYDIIVFASSMQYFSSLYIVIKQCLDLLSHSGEIHIVDTHFYSNNEVEIARKRSSEYFERVGHSKMIDYYYHYSLEDLNSFDSDILYNPNSLINKLSISKNPFYWIRIKP